MLLSPFGCSQCNGTGQVKYYYGDKDDEYNWEPCTSCTEKGYIKIIPSGDSNGGKNQFVVVLRDMKCRNNGGTLAYGYSVDKGTGALVVNPKTAPIVREIFSRYDKGELIKDIVKDLNARGLRNNFGRPFQASAMTILLKSRKYIGDYCYGDMIIPGGVPALVEKDVFERVQKRMKANKKSPGRVKAKEEYLLSGKMFCGTCGGYMVGESGKSRNGMIYYYYK